MIDMQDILNKIAKMKKYFEILAQKAREKHKFILRKKFGSRQKIFHGMLIANQTISGENFAIFGHIAVNHAK